MSDVIDLSRFELRRKIMKLLGTEPPALKEPITPAIEPRALPEPAVPFIKARPYTPSETLRNIGRQAIEDLKWHLDHTTLEEFEDLAAKSYSGIRYPKVSIDEWLTIISDLKGLPPL
jgi:hypothetical protein